MLLQYKINVFDFNSIDPECLDSAIYLNFTLI